MILMLMSITDDQGDHVLNAHEPAVFFIEIIPGI
jgi:hypothetical protein